LIALKQRKNPFLIEHKSYFEMRALRNIRSSCLLDKRKKGILIKQKGVCGHCDQIIDPRDVIQIHHIHSVKHCGSNKLGNLMAVHEECHKQITQSQNKPKK
jgi:RNA-directed DNA polymerase